tara:strand:+ start:961 stop:1296 length:336 start_codon:yes stop_codon:yes gene_type:complete
MSNSININLQLDYLKSLIDKIQLESIACNNTIKIHKSAQTSSDNKDINWIDYAIKLCQRGYKNKTVTVTYKNGTTKKKKLNSLTYSDGEYDPKLDGVFISIIQHNITNITP